MNQSNNKKKSPILFVLFAFVAILIITINTNLQSRKTNDISIPGETIKNLYTLDNQLIAVTDAYMFFVWDWNDIKAQPVSIKSIENSIFCYGQNIICSYSENTGTILLSDTEGREKKSFNIGTNWQFRQLKATTDGKLVGFTMMDTSKNSENNMYKIFQLGLIDTNELKIKNTYKNSPDDNEYYIKNFAISKNGSLFALAGRKNNNDWVALFDMENTQLLWEKTFPDTASSYSRLNEIAFSPDNKIVVAGLIDFHLYTFDSANGNILNKRSMEQKKHMQKERLRISGLQISPDGSFLAAGYEPPGVIWLWNLKKSVSKPKKMTTGNTHISNIAFSNDSTKIVSAGIVPADKTLIWQIKK